jgi:ethanolamine utilization protein EutN
MFIARVKKIITSTIKHPAYEGKQVFLVKPVYPNGKDKGEGNEWVAMDYVGAGIGDLVVCGGAPGVAAEVFKMEKAPIRTLIMAIVDEINYQDIEP